MEISLCYYKSMSEHRCETLNNQCYFLKDPSGDSVAILSEDNHA